MAHGNHHKVHDSHMVIPFFMPCIHEYQLRVLNVKKSISGIPVSMKQNEKVKKGKVTFLTFLYTCCAVMICAI